MIRQESFSSSNTKKQTGLRNIFELFQLQIQLQSLNWIDAGWSSTDIQKYDDKLKKIHIGLISLGMRWASDIFPDE